MSQSTSSPSAFQVDVEHRGTATIVRLVGSANMDVSADLQDRLLELADAPVERLILDLSALEFISSVGLGAFVAAHLRCCHHHGAVKLVAPQPKILELLNVTKLIKLFPIHDSVEAAMTAG